MSGHEHPSAPLLLALMASLALLLTATWMNYERAELAASIPDGRATRGRADDAQIDRDKARRWPACTAARGIPVMGFGMQVVCIDEARVIAIDGRKY